MKCSQRKLKGAHFEKQVETLLKKAEKISGGKITYESKPEIRLPHGEKLYADFNLTIKTLNDDHHYKIECQHRKRSDKDILHKIQFVKQHHHAHTFIFVYAERVGRDLAEKLEHFGTQCWSVERLRNWLLGKANEVRDSWELEVGRQNSRQTLLSTRREEFNSDPAARGLLDEFLKD